MQPPKLEKRPKKHKFWNREIEDDYYYLEENWQGIVKNPKLLPRPIKNYIDKENKYADHFLKDTKKIQKALFKEIRGRIKEDQLSVPVKYENYFYYSYYRKKSGKKKGHYALSCRKFKSLKGKEEIIFDGDKESKNHKYFSYGTGLSLDQKKQIVSIDTKGNEEYVTNVRDIKTKKVLTKKPINTSGNVVFAKKDYLFYCVLSDKRRPYKIMRHQLGDDPKSDLTVYQEADPSFFVSCGLSQDDRFLYINTSQHDTDEILFFECDEDVPKPKLIKKRELDFEYSVSYHPEDDRFFILTNKDNAIDYQIMETSVNAPGVENWKTFLKHKPGTLILGLFVIKGWLVRMVRENFNEEIIVTNLKTYKEHKVHFKGEVQH